VSWADWQADIDHTVREMMRLAPPGQSMPRRASVVLTNPLLALLVYRISHFLQCRGWGFAARLLAGVNVLVHKLTIPPEACLGGGVLMPHLAGVVLHGRAGRNLALFANAVCSCAEDARCIAPDQAPVLGNDVMVGGHSGVFGPVRLGDRVQLGPKVQVAQHVAADLQAWDPHARGTTACAAPPKLVSQVQPLRAREKRPWREGWRRLRRDAARWRAQRGGRGAPVFPGLVCVALFRASHALQGCGWRGAARCCAVLNGFLTGADISPGCEIGGGLLLAHPAGVALHGCAGEDLTVMASAGFGALLRDGGLVTLADAPRLGDRVRIAHHAGVFGPISVGDDVAILPGCIVHEPVSAAVTMRPRGLRIRDRRRIARARAAHPRSGSVS
jgi:serine acetyltransferase